MWCTLERNYHIGAVGVTSWSATIVTHSSRDTRYFRPREAISNSTARIAMAMTEIDPAASSSAR
jgi:hypothetical protein